MGRFPWEIESADLSGKRVAIFGAGDSASFSDTFCDAIGTIYQGLTGYRCTFAGSVSTDGYTFDDSSTAVIDGQFVDCHWTNSMKMARPDGRIDAWLEKTGKRSIIINYL
jgi:flavodoxin I